MGDWGGGAPSKYAPGGGVTVPSNFRDSFLFMYTPFVTELPNIAW